MNKYIFFTPSIVNIGGTERYLSNKIDYLKKNGFEVYVYSAVRGQCLIDALKPYQKYITDVFGVSPYTLKKKDREKIIHKILAPISINCGLIFIESNYFRYAEWAEVIAKFCNAKHIFFYLDEYFNHDLSQIEFLKFKLRRNELFGIHNKSISMMLNEEYIEGKDYPSIRPLSSNVVSDIPYSCKPFFKESDWAIGSIGRLDKAFIPYALEEVLKFAKKNLNKTINLIFIGDGKEANKLNILKQVSICPNVRLFITGYLFPIPRNLIKSMDCFFASAGSAYVSANEGVPTICISADTHKAIGIFNYTVDSTLYSESVNDPFSKSLDDYLNMILKEDFCKKNKLQKKIINVFDRNEEYARQINYFFTNSNIEYYDIRKINHNKLSELIILVFCRVFGVALYFKSRRLIKWIAIKFNWILKRY